MADSLGIYIGKNIIKYAKVSKENNSNSIKINTYGVKAYTDIRETLNQIISETDSLKIPISVNLEGENYNYFEMSSLLGPRDLPKAINTAFESICYDKGENPRAVETRYVLINNLQDVNKLKVIHVSEDIIKLSQLQANFTGKKLAAAVPISFGIANIVPINSKGNIAVVNIEDETSVTLIEREKIYEIKKIGLGSKTILDSITEKENSYAKAYDVCKNTTIYTINKAISEDEQNEYLENIIPTLYEIGNKVKDIIDNSDLKIEKVYITGTAAIINNIDLYFNEILGDDMCSILKPFFVQDNAQINVKDYIEVNSAIALALQGIGFGLKDINFIKNSSSGVDLSSIFSSKGNKNEKTKKSGSINLSILDGAFPIIKYCLTAVLALNIIYIGFSFYTAKEIENKSEQLQSVMDDTKLQISKIETDTSKINRKSTEYKDLIDSLENAKNSIDTKADYKYSIPTLLSKISEYIPKGVQLTSIENPSEKKVIIHAQSVSYEQLAYFKAVLKEEGILKPDSVVSSQAEKSGNDQLKIVQDQVVYERQVVKIVIEGELP